MPITTKLRNGTIVEVISSEKETVPKKEWLDIVKTAKAKREIIELLNENQGEEKTQYLVEIFAEDRVNLVLEITKIFTSIRLNILSLNTIITEDQVKIDTVMETRKIKKVEKLKEELYKIKGVKDIKISEEIGEEE